MASRLAASASTSRLSRPKNPPFFSLSHRNFTLNFHNPPSHPPRSNAFPPLFIRKPGYQWHVRAISEAAAEPSISNKEREAESTKDWKIKMLYDGDCPLCMREVNMLRERNKSYGTIKFVDISSDDYSSEENQGLDYETAMGRIHAILSDGTVITDVEVGKVADSIYGIWAKYRLQITGRPPIEEILEARKKKGDEVCKDSNACKM
ncbi:uncharacterized protein At5g50100, chloroplastic isoform X4 [Abrus precatorius]|uniref:Uncharacterized protein At5g50100, chloroplastic isoform X4 n=1 Tax=Abrus precatorius TaxID=3816 RepID=A0A8B8MJX4_ABRPR|nr:uncharacterized protein At5g50100, chloroplastic isoform X4 [Abrus precatorius]